MKTLILIALTLPQLAFAAGKDDLVRLYEEEVLAHDLYVELGKTHPGIRPFQNIPRSEARHREVMAQVLRAEGIEMPRPPEGRRFISEGLDELYTNWLEEGRKSAVDACRVGVRLEEHDIADLRRGQVDMPKHKEALAGLEAASNNHLRAFHRNLANRGGTYVPVALAAADFEKILGSPQQPGACGNECAGNCKCGEARGQGKGRGNGPRNRAGNGRGPGPNGQGPGPRNGRGGRGPGGPNR